MPENIGHVIQIAGPAVDVQFVEGSMPPIYEALRVVSDGFRCRRPSTSFWKCSSIWAKAGCAASPWRPTDGMVRGMKAIDQGGPISVPVGRGTLGRVMNVIGEPVDQLGPIAAHRDHADPPSRAALRGAGHDGGNVRNRRQGHRPHPAIS